MTRTHPRSHYAAAVLDAAESMHICESAANVHNCLNYMNGPVDAVTDYNTYTPVEPSDLPTEPLPLLSALGSRPKSSHSHSSTNLVLPQDSAKKWLDTFLEILTHNPMNDPVSCGTNITLLDRSCSGTNGLSTSLGALQGSVQAVGSETANAGRMMTKGETAAERSNAAKINNALRNNRGSRVLGKLGRSDAWKLTGYGMLGVSAGASAWSGYEGARANGDSVGKSLAIGGIEGAVDTGTTWAMAEVGASWGASIGTAFGPGIGTLAGAGVGALVGAGVSIFVNNYWNDGISKIVEQHTGW